MLPYAKIPPYPESVTAGNLMGRQIDGAAFRFYWATQDLEGVDLQYRPSIEAMSFLETVQHIHSLSTTIHNTILGKVNERPTQDIQLPLETLRKDILTNLEKASNLIKDMDDQKLGQLKIIFQFPERTSQFPIWNLVNGPIADMVYHTGQLVSFRRTLGNPIPKGVNVFMGTKRSI